jgi:hypothetical protein
MSSGGHHKHIVMAGLDPAIHDLTQGTKDVDARLPPPPRLRRATISLGRSFSEGGKAGHDDDCGMTS